MEVHEAIVGFSQSEKIKAGLIWASQSVQVAISLQNNEKIGAEMLVKALIGMISSEIHLARKLTGNETWLEVQRGIDKAVVMINSGVVQEAAYHLTQALTHVTQLGQESMSWLKENEYLK